MKFSESTAQAIVGIRKHEVCGKSIYVDGRRYVMRAVSDGERPVTLEFAESRLSILLPRFEIEPQALASGLPADSLAAKSDANALGAGVDTVLEMATYRGIPVLLEARSEHELQTIACFTSWPCVFAVILPVSLENGLVSAELSLSKNALRLSRMGPDDGLPAWAHGAVMSFDALASNDADRNYPVFAERRSSGLMAVAAIRRACEQLQCDLAPQYDLAGYIVS